MEELLQWIEYIEDIWQERKARSSTTCKVKYNGNWVIPSTGVEDLTYITYRITYTAG